jgi:hypothetical protein
MDKIKKYFIQFLNDDTKKDYDEMLLLKENFIQTFHRFARLSSISQFHRPVSITNDMVKHAPIIHHREVILSLKAAHVIDGAIMSCLQSEAVEFGNWSDVSSLSDIDKIQHFLVDCDSNLRKKHSFLKNSISLPTKFISMRQNLTSCPYRETNFLPNHIRVSFDVLIHCESRRSSEGMHIVDGFLHDIAIACFARIDTGISYSQFVEIKTPSIVSYLRFSYLVDIDDYFDIRCCSRDDDFENVAFRLRVKGTSLKLRKLTQDFEITAGRHNDFLNAHGSNNILKNYVHDECMQDHSCPLNVKKQSIHADTIDCTEVGGATANLIDSLCRSPYAVCKSPYWNITFYEAIDMAHLPKSFIDLHERLSEYLEINEIVCTCLEQVNILIAMPGAFYVHLPSQIKRTVCNVCVFKPYATHTLHYSNQSIHYEENSVFVTSEDEMFAYPQLDPRACSSKSLVVLQFIYS